MRALDSEVFDAVWSAVEPLLPERTDHHPLGCYRRRISDRVCFRAMLIRLVTGCSWVDVERLVGVKVSDTTLRARRDEWIHAEVFDKVAAEALAAYDRVIGLDLTEVSIDGSLHKAPSGGEGTGKSRVDRGKLGWKWSIATEKNGIPIAWVADGANRHDCTLLPATLEAVETRGLVADIETLHLDRGYDSSAVRHAVAEAGITDLVCARQRRSGKTKLGKRPLPLGLRWPVERTNSWFFNFGQLRRNTDRYLVHRLAQIALPVAFIVTAKLIDWRDRWSI
jgi:transposase